MGLLTFPTRDAAATSPSTSDTDASKLRQGGTADGQGGQPGRGCGAAAFFADNIRTVRPVVEALGRIADLAYTEATKPSEDMFGEVPIGHSQPLPKNLWKLRQEPVSFDWCERSVKAEIRIRSLAHSSLCAFKGHIVWADFYELPAFFFVEAWRLG